MKLRYPLLAASAVALLCSGGAAAADAAAENPVRNPRVIDKLVEMGATLRALGDFRVEADASRDVVLDNGQKIKQLASASLLASGKDKLRVDIRGDRLSRNIYFDGKQLTLYAPATRYYASTPLPGNTAAMLETAEEKLGIEIPLADLFLFGKSQAQLDAIKSAVYVGASTVNGQRCDHLAFREDTIDWQLWVSRGERPLPCKLVVTSTDQSEQPEYSVTYRWNTKAKARAGDFRFQPAKGDLPIPLTSASAQ
ncbi:DUF2092 domain-containing protein [Chitinilyticum litopenaei]|uniref:DUF2092 domain-containing protein n=1 Tax=Chitinilyticum litopenaei TaxID=1121276 RepID=UPI000408B952|nr:DUF2092 domain-containing protein [Chitinilyticum litopenaei]